jgi:hypothetical protein
MLPSTSAPAPLREATVAYEIEGQCRHRGDSQQLLQAYLVRYRWQIQLNDARGDANEHVRETSSPAILMAPQPPQRVRTPSATAA